MTFGTWKPTVLPAPLRIWWIPIETWQGNVGTICPDVYHVHGHPGTPEVWSVWRFRMLWHQTCNLWIVCTASIIWTLTRPSWLLSNCALHLELTHQCDAVLQLLQNELLWHEEVHTNIAQDEFTAVDQGPYALGTTFFRLDWLTYIEYTTVCSQSVAISTCIQFLI